jgi:trans-aconitate 2-methyltransferase
MKRSSWDPQQYDRFAAERREPFEDLTRLLLPAPGARIVDLGCGTGALTRVLHERVGASATLGIDNSETMLARAAEQAGPGLHFEIGDLSRFTADRAYDLVFSNAALHWVDDHAGVLERWTRALAPGGQIAVQLPANFDHPSHVAAAELAREAPFRDALEAHVRDAPALPAEAYAVILDRLGYTKQHVRLQVYAHHLESREDVVEWVKGTLLTDYKRRLGDKLYARFLDEYRARLLPRLEGSRPYLFPFKRILFWGKS